MVRCWSPWPFGMRCCLRAPLDDRARNPALGKLDGHGHANRAAADNHDLLLLVLRLHVYIKDLIGRA